MGPPLDFFFNAAKFPAARDIKLVHAKETIAVDPSAFLQFMGSCANLETLHLGFINFAIPTLFNAAELGPGYVSVLKSLPESITSFTISARGLREKKRDEDEEPENGKPKKKKPKPEEPSKEPSEVLWLGDPALEPGSLLPNLERLKIRVGGESEDSFDTSVWITALKENLGRFCARRRAEGKPVEFAGPERQCDKFAYIKFQL